MPNFTVAANNNTGNSDVKMVFDYSYDSSTFKLLGIKLTGFTDVSYLYPWFPCKNNGSTTPETFIQLNTVEIKGKIMGTGTFRWDDSNSYAYAQGGGGGSTDQIQNVIIPVVNNQINITIDCYLYSTNTYANGYNRKYFNNVTATISLGDSGGEESDSGEDEAPSYSGGNKNTIITATKQDFDHLRESIAYLIQNRSYESTEDDTSSFEDYNNSYKNTISNSLETKEVSPNKVTDTLSGGYFAGAANIIYDLIKNNYMKKPISTTEKTAWETIAAQTEPKQNSIIPALSDYFTIVNYWNTGTDNDNKCNGACTGFCSGSCIGATGGETVTYNDNIQWCPSNCTSSCHHQCYNICEHDCQADCSSVCSIQTDSAVHANCIDNCVGSCLNGCDKSCEGTCGGNNCGNGCNTCSNECNRQCSSTCQKECSTCTGTSTGPFPMTINGCNNNCTSGCQTSCSETCTFSCSETCKGTTTST